MQADQSAILDLLRQQVKAEQDKAAELKRQNDIAEESLKAMQRTLKAEQARTKIWMDISENTASFIGTMPELILLMHGFTEKLGEFGEQLDDYRAEDSKRFNRLEYGLMLLLQGKGNGNRSKAESLLKEMEKDRLRDLLMENQKRLQALEMRKARSGHNVDPAVTIEIEDLKQEIQDLIDAIES